MINIFKIISWLEGISYLLLLFFATPYKYFYHNDTYVKMLGMPHGILFIMYVVLAYFIKIELKWDNKTFCKVLIASIIPFGTFFIGKHLK
jgi:integral membrane protein